MKKNRIERVARGEGKSVVFEKKALKSAKKKSKRSVSRKKWVSRRVFLKAKIDEDDVSAEKCWKGSVFRK